MENKEDTPALFFKGRTYSCSLELTLDVIGGKWKTMMLYRLKDGALRSSELQRMMTRVSNKMFTQTARELERDGIIKREVFPVVPPKVEYSLTPAGTSILPLILQLGEWGLQLAGNTMQERAVNPYTPTAKT